MSKEVIKSSLDILFNSKLRVKVLKYIFRNYPNDFSLVELARRVQEPYESIQGEIKALASLGLVKKKN